MLFRTTRLFLAKLRYSFVFCLELPKQVALRKAFFIICRPYIIWRDQQVAECGMSGQEIKKCKHAIQRISMGRQFTEL